MGDIIRFEAFRLEEPDIDSMSAEELQDLLAQLRQQVEQLDLSEPDDMDSEEYEQWGDRHEELEDRIDEILDRLDDLN